MPSYTLHPSLNTYIQVEGGEVPDVWVVESSQEISRYTVGNLVMVMTMNILMTMTMTMKRQQPDGEQKRGVILERKSCSVVEFCMIVWNQVAMTLMVDTMLMLLKMILIYPHADGCRNRVEGLRECIAEKLQSIAINYNHPHPSIIILIIHIHKSLSS